jgi:hypothetical protein
MEEPKRPKPGMRIDLTAKDIHFGIRGGLYFAVPTYLAFSFGNFYQHRGDLSQFLIPRVIVSSILGFVAIMVIMIIYRVYLGGGNGDKA